jgi:hypothetical protein
MYYEVTMSSFSGPTRVKADGGFEAERLHFSGMLQNPWPKQFESVTAGGKQNGAGSHTTAHDGLLACAGSNLYRALGGITWSNAPQSFTLA